CRSRAYPRWVFWSAPNIPAFIAAVNFSLSHHSLAVCPWCSPLRLVPTSSSSHSLGSMRSTVIHVSPRESETLRGRSFRSRPGERECHPDVPPAPNVRFTDANGTILNTATTTKRGHFISRDKLSWAICYSPSEAKSSFLNRTAYD